MPKNIRRKITRVLQITFRIQPPQSKIIPLNDVKTQIDRHTYNSSQSNHSLKTEDYIDLRDCYTCLSSDSKDSGISLITSLDRNDLPLESTRMFGDDSLPTSSLLTLSPIRKKYGNNVQFDKRSSKCCQCSCHQYDLLNETNNYLSARQGLEQNRIKNKIYPFIF